jgi:hypothetical protein
MVRESHSECWYRISAYQTALRRVQFLLIVGLTLVTGKAFFNKISFVHCKAVAGLFT